MSATTTIDFGIDLGTTNSSIALCRRGEVQVFQTTDLMNVTPSVVYVSKSGRTLVGHKAYDAWVQDPQNTHAEFKRWMGFNDKLTFPASGREFTAEDLSAEVLKSLRADAERATGAPVTSTVITVPAAFGALQCNATDRAAKLAGLTESPLLQEPIAAAIAYGAAPGSGGGERWMVFDLGGGTLDVAVVSSRNGRLAVLEQQGDNRLGGKDIDRLLAEQVLLPQLAAAGFRLPDAQADTSAFARLMRILVRHAEHAKVALSTAAEVTVDLFDLGEDLDGKPVEASPTVTREELERLAGPLVERCLGLARRALEGARLSGADLSRVLLVGGPTQMPVVRAALREGLGAALDGSLDPMTVVARGAALYASTLERAGGAVVSVVTPLPAKRGTVAVHLAYERASGTPLSPVAGTMDAASGVHEVKVDAAGEFWTSGWVEVIGGAFAVDVMLQPGRPATAYRLSARDRAGNAIAAEPTEFTIAFMLPIGAPPLPHTIAVELTAAHGAATYDRLFERHCPLPAEVRKRYKAERTLRPSEVESTLPIKFWEIDVSDDTAERWWAGCVHVRAAEVRRPIPEGSELELILKIDASRKMTVEVYVPLLDQSFTRDVYIPDPPSARTQLQQQMDLCFERMARLREAIYGGGRDFLAEELAELEQCAEDVAERVQQDRRAADRTADFDAALASTDALRKLRVQIARLEEQLNVQSGAPSMTRKLRWQVPYVGRNVGTYGTDVERAEFARLAAQYERYAALNDARGLQWVHTAIWNVHRMAVREQMPYWQDCLRELETPSQRFVNLEQAEKALADAQSAERRGDLARLRTAVQRAWGLQHPDQAEVAWDQAAQSGLRG